MAVRLEKRTARNRYYKNAKFSEYKFKQILRKFAEDCTPKEASRSIKLSLNTINTVYVKIRMHCVALGIFYDFLEESDEKIASDETKQDILEYHKNRMKKRYGIVNDSSKFLHRCESQWRYNYHFVFNLDRQIGFSDQIYADLFEIISVSGPIGGGVSNRNRASEVMLDQMARRITWLERNSLRIKSLGLRTAIQSERQFLQEPFPSQSDDFSRFLAEWKESTETPNSC